jgi:TP901 family phage tail tape measure protein
VNAFAIFGRLALDSSQYDSGLRGAESRTTASANRMAQDWKKIGEAAETLGKNLSVFVTAPLVAFGATSIKTAGDFEAAMNRVRGITRATGVEFQQLENLAKELGATTQFSASQAADAMGFLAMAGFNTNQIISALPGTLELAAAGNLDLARAADIASNVLSGYGMEAEEVGRVNDVLALASISANTNVEQLGNAFKFVAPVASAMGVTIEESAAAIGIMSDAGIQGEMAGTALRNILAELAKESDTLGVSVYDTNGVMLPLADILAQLESRGFTTAESMGEFGMRAGPALQALLSRGSGALRDLTTNLEGAGGTAARLAATNMEGFNGAVLNLRSAVEGLQIAIAQSGLLDFFQSLVERLTGVIRQLSTLDPAVLRVITVVSGLAAAVGPLLFVFGRLLVEIPRMVAAFNVLRGAMLLLFAPPAGIFLAAGAAVVALGMHFFGRRDSLTDKLDKATERSRALASTLGDVNDSQSLAKGVETLANMIGPENSKGRVAFQNYADEIIATSQTAEEAFARIRTVAFETMNAVELRAARTRLAVVEDTIATARALTTPMQSLAEAQALIDELETRRRQVSADRDAALRDGNDAEFRRLRQQAIELGNQIDDAIESHTTLKNLVAEVDQEALSAGFTAGLARAEAEAESLRATIRELQGAVVDTTPAGQALTRTIAGTATATTDAGTAASNTTEDFNRLSLAALDAELSSLRLAQSLATTAEARLDLQQQIETVLALREAMVLTLGAARDLADPGVTGGVSIALGDPGVTVELQSQADAAALLARRYFELAAAERERSEAFAEQFALQQAADAAGLGVAQALPSLIDLLRQQVDAYLAGSAAANELTNANVEARNELLAMESASMGASSGVNDWLDAALRATDAANEMEAGLAGSNAQLRLTPEETANAAAGLVEFLSLQRDLGKATEEDVTRALVNQEAALESLLATLTPASQKWNETAAALVKVRRELNSANRSLLDNAKQALATADANLKLTLANKALGLASETDVVNGLNAQRTALMNVEQQLIAAIATTEEGSAAWLVYVRELTEVRNALSETKDDVDDFDNSIKKLRDSTVAVGSSIERAFASIGSALSTLALTWYDRNQPQWTDLMNSLSDRNRYYRWST